VTYLADMGLNERARLLVPALSRRWKFPFLPSSQSACMVREDLEASKQQDGPKLFSTKVEPRRGCCRVGLDGPQAGVAEEFLDALYAWACLRHFELLDCFVCQFITCSAQWWTDFGHLGSSHSRYMQLMPRFQSSRISFSVR